ncbi:MAG: C39 family peptidase [Nitrospiraceae bacterium]|nr:C39 family peptidase [Nitrospiraceae bacterium]
MILDVPQYYQSKKDYSCGPMAIRMVADYYLKKEAREMTATEWLSTLEITMNNNIRRKLGTKREDFVRALRKLGFTTRSIKGSNYKARLKSISDAIVRKHPVIIFCIMKPKRNKYLHFAVVVGIDNDSIYVRDPYPRTRNTQRPRKISLKNFEAISPAIGGLVWGRSKWGVEVIK